MDTASSLKSLLLAINQYKNSKTVQNASQLQKHLDVISGFKSSKLFASNQVLPNECLSSLVELVADPNSNTSLTLQITGLLSQLVSDDETRDTLLNSCNLISALASAVHSNSSTPKAQVVLQSLHLLQKITYNARVSHSNANVDDLLTFMMQHIQTPDEDLMIPCLGLMANLCRHNLSVQAYIKSLSNVKSFYRTLITFLAHNSLTVVVFALSILTSLTFNEEVGEKIFHGKNIHQTFQLIFNIIVNGDGTLTRKYAVDLLVDLLKNPKIADYLSRYEHFSLCLSQVLGLLHGKDPDSAEKVLQLLIAFCLDGNLCKILCKTIFATHIFAANDCKKGSNGKIIEPVISLLHWCSQEDHQNSCLLALELIKELLLEAIDSTLSSSLQPFVDFLLPILLELLQVPVQPPHDSSAKKKCARTVRAIDILLVLTDDESFKMNIAKRITANMCVSILEYQFSSNSMEIDFGSYFSVFGIIDADIVLKTLNLMSKIKHLVPNLETSFYKILQDQRLISPLSAALTSDDRQRVQTALRLLFEAAPLPDFPAMVLGESIAANNSYRKHTTDILVRGKPVHDSSSIMPKQCCQTYSGDGPPKSNIQNLIEKLQTGIELKEQIKDKRVSDIIDVYEQKISALALEEGRLQDLLEAKALALAQSDRLIVQYRCQRVQAEEEVRKLATLLKDAERKNEELSVLFNNQQLESERAKDDIERLYQHNRKLQIVAEEHESLKMSFSDLANTYDGTEKQLKDLQAAHNNLNKQAEMIKKQNENLKFQHDKTLAQLSEVEEKRKEVIKELQDKDNLISSLQQRIVQLERNVEIKEKEKEDMEETIDILRKELSKTELARKELSIKASSLEIQKSQLEARLAEKEAMVKSQQEELNKHSHMIAMIHSLSSGKMKTDSVNLSL
ncbi:protein CIP2A [Polypterus senegalus]|uniref:protein CIP2A n=1 Tax=Polypterus senegalus TaxID=55291 RepID=UPI0019647789|nr:protein CIP2A [Polypterus senegalus]XP_039601455.1 protein CIP2A [Polypterus senegalus]XP_039601457.1 protein CIP2A [Polypterus senegalus]